MRKDKHFLAFTDQAAAVMVFAEGSSNSASPMLFGNAAVQKVVPSFLVPTFCPSALPPSPRDGQQHFYIALGKSRGGRELFSFFFRPLLRCDTCPVRPHIV